MSPLSPAETWYALANKSPEEKEALKKAWASDLSYEVGFNMFNVFLARLQEKCAQGKLVASQVAEVIETVCVSPECRKEIFELADEGVGECQDRRLAYLAQMVCFADYAKLRQRQADERAIVALAKGMWLGDVIVTEVTPLLMHRQWKERRRAGNNSVDAATGRIVNNGMGTGPNTGEALELLLALRYALKEFLPAAFAVEGWYATPYFTSLDKEDIKIARAYLEEVMKNSERLVSGVAAQPIWRHFLKSVSGFATQEQVAKKSFLEAAEDLFNRSASMRNHEFKRLNDQQAVQLDNTIADLCSKYTEQILRRLGLVDVNKPNSREE